MVGRPANLHWRFRATLWRMLRDTSRWARHLPSARPALWIGRLRYGSDCDRDWYVWLFSDVADTWVAARSRSEAVRVYESLRGCKFESGACLKVIDLDVREFRRDVERSAADEPEVSLRQLMRETLRFDDTTGFIVATSEV